MFATYDYVWYPEGNDIVILQNQSISSYDPYVTIQTKVFGIPTVSDSSAIKIKYTYRISVPSDPTKEIGCYSYYLDFDGSDDYIQLPSVDSIIQNGSFAVEFDVQYDALPSAGNIGSLISLNESSGSRLRVGLTTGSQIFAEFGTTSGTTAITYSSAVTMVDRRITLKAIFTESSTDGIKIFLDGTEITGYTTSTVRSTTAITFASWKHLAVNPVLMADTTDGFDSYVNGKLFRFSMYNDTDDSKIVEYKLSEGRGTILGDSYSERTATISGLPTWSISEIKHKLPHTYQMAVVDYVKYRLSEDMGDLNLSRVHYNRFIGRMERAGSLRKSARIIGVNTILGVK